MRRYVPWVLLGTLALATALGVTLGLAEAPVTSRTPAARLSGPSPRSTPTTSSPPSAIASPVPSPTTALPIAAPPCTAHLLQLTTSAVDTVGSATSSDGALALTNQSPAACELSTTPVFQIVGTGGVVMATTGSPGAGIEINDVIQTGETQTADLDWQNWCGADFKPLKLSVILPNASGTVSSPYGDASTMLPTCSDASLPSTLLPRGLLPNGSGGLGTLFGR